MWHVILSWSLRIFAEAWAILVLMFLIAYAWFCHSVKKEVAGYPRVEMMVCDKHGPIQLEKETMMVPDIRTSDGQPIPMCLYCYYESSIAMDKKLKEAKQGI